jgi:hypothetical protein
MHVIYEIDLGGKPGIVEDPKGSLGLQIDKKAPWHLTLSVGAWDADALSAFVQGTIKLPIGSGNAT